MEKEKIKISLKNVKKNNKLQKAPFGIYLLRFLFKMLGPFAPQMAARHALKIFMTPKRHRKVSFSGIFNKAYLIGTPYKNTRITSYMWGEKGKIVLLVHGWESSSRIYESFVLPMVKAGYRVVAIDGPAHGGSSLKETNMLDFGDALHAVIKNFEKIGEIYAMIGHSFGGSSLINMLYRKGKPPFLEKIVLIAIPSRLDNIFNHFFQYLQLPKSVIYQFKILLREKFNLKIEDLDVKNWIPQLRLSKILVLHDIHDKVIPSQEAEELASSGDNFNLLLTEGLGHNRIMKDQDVINNIISYLHELPAVTDQKRQVNYQNA